MRFMEWLFGPRKPGRPGRRKVRRQAAAIRAKTAAARRQVTGTDMMLTRRDRSPR